MNGPEIEALRAARIAPNPEAFALLRRQLPDLGDGIAAQMAELERDFTPERAERLLHNLGGVCAHVRRLVAMEEAG